MNFLFKVSSLTIPRLSLSILLLEPFLMVSLNILNLLLQFSNLSFMESSHFLNSQIQCLNLFVFVGYLSLKLSSLSDHFFCINSLWLKSLSMLNLCHRNFRSLIFNLFLMKHDQILKLLMLSFIFDFKFIESVIILFSKLKFGMDLVGKLLSDVSQ